MLERIAAWSDITSKKVTQEAIASSNTTTSANARDVVDSAPIEDLRLAWAEAPTAELKGAGYTRLRQLRVARDASLVRRAGLDLRLTRRLRLTLAELETMASRSIAPVVSQDPSTKCFANILALVERAMEMEPAQRASNEILTRHQDEIRDLMDTAMPLTDPDLWKGMHQGLRDRTRGRYVAELQREADQAAVEACAELMSLLSEHSEYRTSYTNVFRYGRAVCSTPQTSPEAIWKRDRDRVSAWISTHTPEITNNSKTALPPRNASGLERVTELRDIATTLDAITSAAMHLPDSIRDAAFARIREQASDEISSLPLVRLRRSLPSKRPITVLQAQGYETIGQVMRLSVAELATLDGISQKGASSVLAACADVCEQAASGLSVRLEPDRRTESSNALVKGLASYMALEGTLDQKRHLALETKSMVGEVEAATECARSDLSWVLADDKERVRATDALDAMAKSLDDGMMNDIQSTRDHLMDVLKTSAGQAWADFMNDPVAFVSTLEELVPELISDDGRYGLPEHIAKDVEEQPLDTTGLSCKLRPYQTMGAKYALCQRRALLGDEMGLGKTVQAIAAMVSARNEGDSHMVVVCPASVLVNWQREIAAMSDLVTHVVHGTKAKAAAKEWLEHGGVAVTTYMNASKIELDDERGIDMLVVDEAHLVKHRNTKSAREVARLTAKSRRVLMMTGTPLENDVDEMLDLVERLNADVAIALEQLADVGDTTTFRDAAAPVYYRRKRDQVLAELPPLVESDQWCDMGRLERKNYEAAKAEKRLDDVRRLSWRVDDVRRHSSKAKRLLEIVREAKADGRRVLVFSHYLDTIRKAADLLGKACVGTITGATSPDERQSAVDALEKAPAGSTLVCQIESAGTGLNIQAASVIVICEPQLKPSTETQAISRAYRMGQTRSVLVYRLLCSDTDEEAYVRRLREKQEAFDAYADKSSAAEIDGTAMLREMLEMDEKEE